MAYSQVFRLLRQKMGILVLFGLLFGALGFVGLMLTEKRFQSSMDFLVVQANVGNQDFYTQFKSSEYLGKILSEAIYSERFINAVVETGKVNAEFLPFDKKDRLKTWSEMVSVENNLELGIISVTVKSDRERDAARVMDGIAKVLTEQNQLFRGGDEKSVDIRVLSGPIVEQTPSLTKTITVTLGAFAVGVLATLFIVTVKSQALRKEKDDIEDINASLGDMPV